MNFHNLQQLSVESRNLAPAGTEKGAEDPTPALIKIISTVAWWFCFYFYFERLLWVRGTTPEGPPHGLRPQAPCPAPRRFPEPLGNFRNPSWLPGAPSAPSVPSRMRTPSVLRRSSGRGRPLLPPPSDSFRSCGADVTSALYKRAGGRRGAAVAAEGRRRRHGDGELRTDPVRAAAGRRARLLPTSLG